MFTTSRRCEEFLLRATTSTPRAPCDVGGLMTEKLLPKTLPIRTSPYWIYKEEIGKHPRKMINGPKSVQRSTESPNGRGIPRPVMEVGDDGTSSLSDKKGSSPQKSWAQVVSQVALAPSSKEYESDASFIESGAYCRVCYRSNHVKS